MTTTEVRTLAGSVAVLETIVVVVGSGASAAASAAREGSVRDDANA